MRMKESWKEMKLWDAEELNKLDWVISALILIFLFFTCAYGDLMLTGNRSFLMYEHFTDFYKASYEIYMEDEYEKYKALTGGDG